MPPIPHRVEKQAQYPEEKAPSMAPSYPSEKAAPADASSLLPLSHHAAHAGGHDAEQQQQKRKQQERKRKARREWVERARKPITLLYAAASLYLLSMLILGDAVPTPSSLGSLGLGLFGAHHPPHPHHHEDHHGALQQQHKAEAGYAKHMGEVTGLPLWQAISPMPVPLPHRHISSGAGDSAARGGAGFNASPDLSLALSYLPTSSASYDSSSSSSSSNSTDLSSSPSSSSTTSNSDSDSDAARRSLAGSSHAQLWSSYFLSVPSPRGARAWSRRYTNRTHVAGSTGDQTSALYTAQLWADLLGERGFPRGDPRARAANGGAKKGYGGAEPGEGDDAPGQGDGAGEGWNWAREKEGLELTLRWARRKVYEAGSTASRDALTLGMDEWAAKYGDAGHGHGKGIRASGRPLMCRLRALLRSVGLAPKRSSVHGLEKHHHDDHEHKHKKHHKHHKHHGHKHHEKKPPRMQTDPRVWVDTYHVWLNRPLNQSLFLSAKPTEQVPSPEPSFTASRESGPSSLHRCLPCMTAESAAHHSTSRPFSLL